MPANTYPGLGPVDAAPLLNMQWNPAGADLTPEHYFVLTRVDGKTPLKQIVLISGFGEDKALAILVKLKEAGAIYFQGEVPARAATARPATKPPEGKPRSIGTADTLRPGTIPGDKDKPGTVPPRPPDPNTKIDEAALAEECDLTVEQKRVILIKQASLKNGTLFDVLEVPPEADKRALKRAYFKMSKDFHPDRFYGKNLGSYRERLDRIFAVATKAFEHLDDDGRRTAYVASLASAVPAQPGKPATIPPSGQSPAARAVELFDLACQHQVTGDTKRAMQEFAAAIRLDPQPRFFRRAAEAALRAQELRSAEEYATKAAELDPRDAGTLRMLAKVHRAMGRLGEARSALERAKRLDPGNRYIAAELDEVMADLGKG